MGCRHTGIVSSQLQAAHWRVLHFSGAEFHRRPQACIEEVFATVEAAYAELRRLIWGTIYIST